MKEKERARRALLSLLAGQFPSKVLMLGMVCLWSEGIASFLCATVWCSLFCEDFQCVDLTLCMRVEGVVKLF